MKTAENRPNSGRTPTLSSQQKKYLLRRLWSYLSRDKWLLVLAFFLTVVSNLLALAGPKLSGYAIDAIAPPSGGVDFHQVFLYAFWMLIFYLCSSGLSYLLSVFMIRLGQKVASQLRSDIFGRLAELPVEFYDTHQAGDLISRISYDVDTIHSSLSTDLLQIGTSIITVLGAFIMMLSISPVLLLVFVVTVPITIVTTRVLSRRVRPLFRKRSGKLGELNGFAEEFTAGIRTIKAYHQESSVVNRFDQKNEEAVEAYFQADYASSSVGPAVNFINNLSLSLVSVFGALLYLYGRISLGDISSFVLYSRKFSGPINETANILAELQSAFAAAERVFRLMDEEPEPADRPGARNLTHASGDVTLDQVSFGYVPGKEIIHDLSLQVKSGDLVAVVGPTGAGKTTLINLLMRFYDVEKGRITMDGIDIRDITRKSLRLSYTMVLQDTWLFYGSVFDNIAYGAADGTHPATREEVEQAARAAKIHRFIAGLPQGYDTILSDNAANLSKGQKQLITIARAMLSTSQLLILDEATSNVDTQTEEAIGEAMRELMRGKTCFVIAHRLSTIRSADCILVVRDGEIVETGTHQELLRQGGFYKQLYDAQFESY